MTNDNYGYEDAIAERVNGNSKDEVDRDAIVPSVIDAQPSVLIPNP